MLVSAIQWLLRLLIAAAWHSAAFRSKHGRRKGRPFSKRGNSAKWSAAIVSRNSAVIVALSYSVRSAMKKL
jgi:uncharacterized membrane protein